MIEKDKYTTKCDKNIKMGWVCPVCGKVYSPTVKKCPTCQIVDNDKRQLLLEVNEYYWSGI